MNESSSQTPNRLRWCELIDQHLLGVISRDDAIELEATLALSREAREDYRQRCNIDVALRQESVGQAILNQVATAPEAGSRSTWRPLTAAAAGIVFGMFCTSMVFGFVAQRAGIKQTRMTVFDAGLENARQNLKDSLPDRIGQWGMDAARVVAAEGTIKPLQGERMMRLEPIPRSKEVKNHTSRLYQMLDLRPLPIEDISSDAEVQVSASFCPSESAISSRYLIRAIALDETPESARKNFWSKVESDGVVSESQRFDTAPGDSGWHTFSMKLRLPPGSKTLVLIFGAMPPDDGSQPALVHYFDDVQVSLLTPSPISK
jgi:hypothetical protein